MPYNLVNSSTDEMLANLGKLAVVAASGSEAPVSVAGETAVDSSKIGVEEWVQFKGKVAIADELIVGKLAILNEVQILKNLKVLGDIRLAGNLQIDGAVTLKFFEAEANSLQVGDAVAIAGDKLVRRAGSNDTTYKPAIGLVASISSDMGDKRIVQVAVSGVVKNLKDLQAGAIYFLAQNDGELSTQTIDKLLAQVDQIANGTANIYNLTPNTSPSIENGSVARGLTPKVSDAEGQMVQVLGVARSVNEFVIMPSLQVAIIGKDGSVANLFNSTFWNAISAGSTGVVASPTNNSQPIASEPNTYNPTPITSSGSPFDSTNPLTSISEPTTNIPSISEPITSTTPAPPSTDTGVIAPTTSATVAPDATAPTSTAPTISTISSAPIIPISTPAPSLITVPITYNLTPNISSATAPVSATTASSEPITNNLIPITSAPIVSATISSAPVTSSSVAPSTEFSPALVPSTESSSAPAS
ncbi:MAG: hypothetical protein A2117_00680 [Candidatus Wildermuthbacteria bacterium GWA2_46_15]|uniref:Uncharacterized protein n=1 Tax=Candidatus Wildermuthbacteria bacterium GWA2_46_15 TaxID=1802443 RepID=A0A1G2QP43_9BACT|nr:MAG: hypothetical protein A2117_00680 [Candidatus Wildermuthbacteria bacterium GWA2_46_15]